MKLEKSFKKPPGHADYLFRHPTRKVGDGKVYYMHVLDRASGNVLWDAEINSARRPLFTFEHQGKFL